jgi:hypothetical protein
MLQSGIRGDRLGFYQVYMMVKQTVAMPVDIADHELSIADLDWLLNPI